ncbi:hypothetical protein [Micromonospora coxensis]|uniref:hypothetical protein n=1 Tax=Micromonospora coxensis TaxID=356852 RepID=UPI00342D1F51
MAGDDGGDLAGGGVGSFGADAFGDADALAGVEGDAAVFDGFLHDHRQDHDHVGGGSGCQAFAEGDGEGLDVLAADVGQG